MTEAVETDLSQLDELIFLQTVSSALEKMVMTLNRAVPDVQTCYAGDVMIEVGSVMVTAANRCAMYVSIGIAPRMDRAEQYRKLLDSCQVVMLTERERVVQPLFRGWTQLGIECEEGSATRWDRCYFTLECKAAIDTSPFQLLRLLDGYLHASYRSAAAALLLQGRGIEHIEYPPDVRALRDFAKQLKDRLLAGQD